MDKALEAQRGDAVAQVQELERAIEYAESAIEAGREEIRLQAALEPAHFDSLAAPIEKNVAAPWLKKLTEDGIEVVRKAYWEPGKQTGSWVKATAEDLESGVFYEKGDEYLKANPS